MEKATKLNDILRKALKADFNVSMRIHYHYLFEKLTQEDNETTE